MVNIVRELLGFDKNESESEKISTQVNKVKIDKIRNRIKQMKDQSQEEE